jgi:transcriptional regulator with XRE-family HTH domain
MHPGEFIKNRRLALGYEPDEVAQQVGLNVPGYYDLEQVDSELSSVVSLGEIAKLEQLLTFEIRAILSEWKQPPNLTLQDLAELIRTHLRTNGQTLADFENAAGWEVGPMLHDPKVALDWTVDYLAGVCSGLGIPWQSVKFEAEVKTTRPAKS